VIPAALVVSGMSPYETKHDATFLVTAGEVAGASGPWTAFRPP